MEDTATQTTDAETETSTPTQTMREIDWPIWEDLETTDEQEQEAARIAESLISEAFGTGATSTEWFENTTTAMGEPTSVSAEPTTTSEEPPVTTTDEASTSTEDVPSSMTEELPTTTAEEPPSTTTEEPPLTTTEEPPSTAIEEPPTTSSSEEPAIPTTPLERQDIVCHNEADFPGHADIASSTQHDFSVTFSGLTVEGSEISDDLGPDSAPIEMTKKDKHGVTYTYTASWVEGCATAKGTQSFRFPLGMGSSVTAYLLVRENYTKCKSSYSPPFFGFGC